MKRKIALPTTSLVLMFLLAAPASGASVRRQLAAVRQATAEYHNVGRALADGYLQFSGCVAVPGLGGMGYHYGKPALLAPGVDTRTPELLLYAPSGNRLRLVGVEYSADDADQDLTTDADRPSLFGRPFDGPMLGHDPGQPIHYDLHVWLWQGNPDGMFAQFNPNLSC